MSDRITKGNYVTRALSKLTYKRWELYVVSRVIHRLNDLDIEFVCQQLVLLEDGKRALADMFFPQFNIYLEVNEPGGHSSKKSQINDEKRRAEILKVSGAKQYRIEIFNIDTDGNIADESLGLINQNVDKFVDLLKEKKREYQGRGNFIPWNLDDKYDPIKFLEKGYLETLENPSFRTQRDALRCFGYDGGHYQRAVWRKPEWDDQVVWFPRFVSHKTWRNELSHDERLITETLLDESLLEKMVNLSLIRTRFTFAKTCDALGRRLYRFVGVFDLQDQKINKDGQLVRTYSLLTAKVFIPNPEKALAR